MPLSPSEREEYLMLDAELERRKLLSSLRAFSAESWHINEGSEVYVDGWHIGAICDHLEAVARGEIRNLLINMPPRHMKSTLVTVAFNAWLWTFDPGRRFLCASYGQALSTRDGVKTRNIVESPWYQRTFRPDWKLADDQNAKQKFVNTKGGHRISTSVTGSVTGEGGDVIIFDDPHNKIEVKSTASRKEVIEFWDGSVSSRGNNPKTVAKIVVMQRLHDRDLSGHLIAKGGYEHLCLPAEYKGKVYSTSIWKDPRTQDGELLWPERFGRKEVDELRGEMGGMEAAGQLDQEPVPEGGAIVKSDWWKFYKVLPERFDMVYDSWDLTFEETEKGSYVVGQKWGKVGANKYLLAQTRRRMGFNEQIPAVLALRNMQFGINTTSAVLVEKAANGAALLAVLKTRIPGMIPIKALGSKTARAEAASPQIEAGNVYLPDPEMQSWVAGYIKEWAVAPNGDDWDQIDATSQLLLKWNTKVTYDWTPGSMIQESKWTGSG